jgi:hypothetical protein
VTANKQDVEYFRRILKRHGIFLPETMYEEVKADQRARVGNRVVTYTEKEKENDPQQSGAQVD